MSKYVEAVSYAGETLPVYESATGGGEFFYDGEWIALDESMETFWQEWNVDFGFVGNVYKFNPEGERDA